MQLFLVWGEGARNIKLIVFACYIHIYKEQGFTNNTVGLVLLFGTAYNLQDLRPFCRIGQYCIIFDYKLQALKLHNLDLVLSINI